MTKLRTEAVSRLIVADIYGGFCRSVFTQFCCSLAINYPGRAAENNWNNYTPAASQDKDLLFYCTPRGVAWNIIVVQITSINEEFYSLVYGKKHSNIFNVLEETPLDLFSPLGLFVTCELWVEKMVEKVSRT